jgi:hypothetical protein
VRGGRGVGKPKELVGRTGIGWMGEGLQVPQEFLTDESSRCRESRFGDSGRKVRKEGGQADHKLSSVETSSKPRLEQRGGSHISPALTLRSRCSKLPRGLSSR